MSNKEMYLKGIEHITVNLNNFDPKSRCLISISKMPTVLLLARMMNMDALDVAIDVYRSVPEPSLLGLS